MLCVDVFIPPRKCDSDPLASSEAALPFDELAALSQRIVEHKLMFAIAQLHVVCGRVYTPSQV